MSERYIAGIGAANIDIYGKSSIPIRTHYDHPGLIRTGAGGVTRNILENTARLKVRSCLLSAVGDDLYAEELIRTSEEAGIDMSAIKKVKGAHTSIFMQVQDNDNDMHLALCDMSVNANIDIAYLRRKRELLKNAAAIVIDPSLDDEVIEYLLKTYSKVPFFVDPVSDNYARKMSRHLSGIFCIKPNISELSELSGIGIESGSDLKKAVKAVLDKGVKKIYVSLGKKGCLYADSEGNCIRRHFRAVRKMVNASGAGDAFFAATVYGYVKGLGAEETIDKALAAGIAAVQVEEAINRKMSVRLLNSIIKEYK
ncbi:MAG: carbohydrate kinase family protein [Erysipelotrichaceae bacterium]|nr:carbohydrate kinase family protein [Erysipelotrichaceae bacterium]